MGCTGAFERAAQVSREVQRVGEPLQVALCFDDWLVLLEDASE